MKERTDVCIFHLFRLHNKGPGVRKISPVGKNAPLFPNEVTIDLWTQQPCKPTKNNLEKHSSYPSYEEPYLIWVQRYAPIHQYKSFLSIINAFLFANAKKTINIVHQKFIIIFFLIEINERDCWPNNVLVLKFTLL